jgi:hypothetical protein
MCVYLLINIVYMQFLQSIMARERIFDATSSDESVTDHMNNA